MEGQQQPTRKGTPALCINMLGDNDRWMDTEAAALYIGKSRAWLEQSRMPEYVTAEGGPPYYRIGWSIKYLKTDLDAWLAPHRKEVRANVAA